MPPGILIPGAGPLTSVGSSNLAGADFPVPSTPAWKLLDILGPGARTPVLPGVAPLSRAGISSPFHGYVIFDRIHVIPRKADLGAVLSDQELDVEVWNAWLSRARVLEEITIDGPAGIEVEDSDQIPVHFPASDSRIFTVHVLYTGDPLLDNVVTWLFDGSPPGTDLTLTGFRLIAFPFSASIEATIRESYGYLSDVMQGLNGSEQRVCLRDVPHGRIEFSALFPDARSAAHASAILQGNQGRAWGVPRWQHSSRLLVAATEGDTEIQLDTAWTPYFASGMVLLWRSPFDWSIQTINSVESDRLILSLPLRRSWQVLGTVIAPVVVGYLSPSETFVWHALEVGSLQLGFDVEAMGA